MLRGKSWEKLSVRSERGLKDQSSQRTTQPWASRELSEMA